MKKLWTPPKIRAAATEKMGSLTIHNEMGETSNKFCTDSESQNVMI